MASQERYDFIFAMILAAWILGVAGPVRAEDTPGDRRLEAVVEQSRSFSGGAPNRLAGDVLLQALVLPRSETARLDLSPFIREFTEFLSNHGIPLQPQRDAKGRETLGVAATFKLREQLPAVRFQAGEAIEPLGAFYSDRGFRCSLVWPTRFLSFRLEGGEDSEFGYFGIAGAQWTHPEKPVAVGFGIPLNLRNANGAVGAVLQLRLKLD